MRAPRIVLAALAAAAIIVPVGAGTAAADDDDFDTNPGSGISWQTTSDGGSVTFFGNDGGFQDTSQFSD